MKAKTIFGWFYMPSTPEKATEIIDTKYEEIYAMAEPDFDWQKEPRRFPITHFKFNYRCMVDMLLYIMEPAYYRVHEQYLRVLSGQRASRIIIALRRYKNKNGVWPESLDEIKSLAPEEIFVDPTNGDSFVYKLTEENFTLYSKGKNNIDEGGKNQWFYDAKNDKWSYKKAGPDDWLIWPRRSRKTQEKKANAEQQ